MEGEIEIVRGLHGSVRSARDADARRRPQRGRDAGRLTACRLRRRTRPRRDGLADSARGSRRSARGEARGLLSHGRPRRAASQCAAARGRASSSAAEARRRSSATCAQGARFARRTRGARHTPTTACRPCAAWKTSRSPAFRLRHFEHFVRALAYVKKAAALANCELGVLDPQTAGRHREGLRRDHRRQAARPFRRRHDPGRRRHLDQHERQRGHRQPRARTARPSQRANTSTCHPNDHVNCSQSTNDAYPTAIKLGVVLTLRDTLSALRELQSCARGQGAGVRRRAQDGPHGKPGRRADDARPGIRRLRRDDRRRHPPP